MDSLSKHEMFDVMTKLGPKGTIGSVVSRTCVMCNQPTQYWFFLLLARVCPGCHHSNPLAHVTTMSFALSSNLCCRSTVVQYCKDDSHLIGSAKASKDRELFQLVAGATLGQDHNLLKQQELAASQFGFHCLTGSWFYTDTAQIVVKKPGLEESKEVTSLKKAFEMAECGWTIRVDDDLVVEKSFSDQPLVISTPVRLIGNHITKTKIRLLQSSIVCICVCEMDNLVIESGDQAFGSHNPTVPEHAFPAFQMSLGQARYHKCLCTFRCTHLPLPVGQVKVTNCEIMGHEGAGILVQGGKPQILDNKIHSGSYSGVTLNKTGSALSHVRIERNIFRNLGSWSLQADPDFQHLRSYFLENNDNDETCNTKASGGYTSFF